MKREAILAKIKGALRMSNKKKDDIFSGMKTVHNIVFDVNIERHASSNKKQIQRKSDFFKVLLSNWDPESLSTKKEYYLLGLDKNQNIICNIYCKPKGAINDVDLLELFAIAKQANLKKIIVGENEPFRQVEPNPYRRELATLLEEYAKTSKIDLVDQMIISDHSFFSFEENANHKLRASTVSIF